MIKTNILNYTVGYKIKLVSKTNIQEMDTFRSKNYFIFYDYADVDQKIFFLRNGVLKSSFRKNNCK